MKYRTGNPIVWHVPSGESNRKSAAAAVRLRKRAQREDEWPRPNRRKKKKVFFQVGRVAFSHGPQAPSLPLSCFPAVSCVTLTFWPFLVKVRCKRLNYLKKMGTKEKRSQSSKWAVSEHRKYLSHWFGVCVCLHARVCFVSVCACARQSLFCILTVQEEGKSPRSQPVATKSGFLVARFPGIDEAALSPGSKHVLFLTCFHGS